MEFDLASRISDENFDIENQSKQVVASTSTKKTSTKNFTRDFLMIIIVGLISYVLDIALHHKNYIKCYTAGTQLSLALHHIFAIFVYVGWLSNNTYILYGILFFIPLVIAHWMTNDDKCVWSESIRTACGNTQPFQSLPRQLGLVKDDSPTLNRILPLIVWLIVAYKLFIRK